VFCAVAGGVWGGKRPHIWGNTKISAKRNEQKMGEGWGEGNFLLEREKEGVRKKMDKLFNFKQILLN